MGKFTNVRTTSHNLWEEWTYVSDDGLTCLVTTHTEFYPEHNYDEFTIEDILDETGEAQSILRDELDDIDWEVDAEKDVGILPLRERVIETLLNTIGGDERRWETRMNGQELQEFLRGPSDDQERLDPTETFHIRAGTFLLEGQAYDWWSLEDSGALEILYRGILLDTKFWKREEEPT